MRLITLCRLIPSHLYFMHTNFFTLAKFPSQVHLPFNMSLDYMQVYPGNYKLSTAFFRPPARLTEYHEIGGRGSRACQVPYSPIPLPAFYGIVKPIWATYYTKANQRSFARGRTTRASSCALRTRPRRSTAGKRRSFRARGRSTPRSQTLFLISLRDAA